MMFRKTPLASAISSAIVASAFAAGAAAPALAEEADALMEEVVVTGSRIKRSTNTSSQEIITFTSEEMQLSGDISVSDALRSSTMNSIGSFRESSGNSAQSNATIDLRGAGYNRTLVLVNGRRAG
ncbi:MAG: TonB-dependent receptor plug domain-containing protein, partial [Pseudomonadales bacterium]|nr:TonB-dependent receptor plug domain-containing protein [Pseudomonadales bacterium]